MLEDRGDTRHKLEQQSQKSVESVACYNKLDLEMMQARLELVSPAWASCFNMSRVHRPTTTLWVLLKRVFFNKDNLMCQETEPLFSLAFWSLFLYSVLITLMFCIYSWSTDLYDLSSLDVSVHLTTTCNAHKRARNRETERKRDTRRTETKRRICWTQRCRAL